VTVARAQCPFIEVLRAKYRGPETQVLIAKCSNTRIYCTSLCKNTAAATEEERGGINGLKNRSGQWEGPGGGGACPFVRLSDPTVLRFNPPAKPACIFYGRTGSANELK